MLPEGVEGEAGDGPDACAHEALVVLYGVQEVALEVVQVDGLVRRTAVTSTQHASFSITLYQDVYKTPVKNTIILYDILSRNLHIVLCVGWNFLISICINFSTETGF